jgi:maleate isomerase
MDRGALVLGAIYPDDMWVDEDIQRMLDDFRRFVPEEVRMVTVRTNIPMKDNTVEFGTWLAENGDIPAAATRLMRYHPNVFAYYCTTVSFVRGVAGDEDLKRRVQEATGIPCTTTSTAIVQALHRLGIRRVAVASPYLPDVNQALTRYLAECDIEVVNSEALHLEQDHGLVPPERIRAAAERADVPEAEAILISCTGQKTADFISDLERKAGKPVVSSNQATGWHALRMLGIEAPRLPGRGRLFGD